jgi:hypothetical protein
VGGGGHPPHHRFVMGLGIKMGGCQTYHLCEGEGFLVGGGGGGWGWSSLLSTDL